MKKVVCLGLVVCLLLASGCSRMLEREYVSVEKHYEQYIEDETSALAVRNYMGLKNALLYLVGERQEYGVIRVYDYSGDVSEDLTEVCLDIKQDTPIGAYAVDYTSHEKVSLVAYTELRVYITYRRSKEQIKTVRSISAELLEETLRQALAEGDEYLALQLNYFVHDRAYVEEMLGRLVEEMNPADPLGYTVQFYPETGVQHIIELNIDYPGGAHTFLQRTQSMNVARQAILRELPEGLDDAGTAEALAEILLARSAYDPEADSDAYAAVVARTADDRGFAEAMVDLCREAGLDCIVVEGSYEGHDWCWNMVQLEQGRYHLDLLHRGGELLADVEMGEAYVWADTYPVSGESLNPVVPEPLPEAPEEDGEEAVAVAAEEIPEETEEKV